MRGAPVRPTSPAAWGRSRSVRRLEEDEQVGRGGELRGEPGGAPGVAGGRARAAKTRRGRAAGPEGRGGRAAGRRRGCGGTRAGPAAGGLGLSPPVAFVSLAAPQRPRRSLVRAQPRLQLPPRPWRPPPPSRMVCFLAGLGPGSRPSAPRLGAAAPRGWGGRTWVQPRL